MPPEEIKNKINFDTLKVGINPVFNGNSDQEEKKVDSETGSGVSAVLDNQKYTPSKIPETFPEIEIKKGETKSIVRTYKDDIEAAIRENHLSSINIAMAENDKNRNKNNRIEEEKIVPESNYSKSKIIILFSIILIIIGIAGVGITYFLNRNDKTIKVQELPALITTEYKDELNISTIIKGKFINALSSRLNDTQIPVNNLYNVYITSGASTTKTLLTSSEFVSLADFKMPDIIKRTLLPDYMVGMFTFGENLPFIIFKSSYFENAYAGMLGWEKDLEKDLKVLFRLTGYENNDSILDKLTPTSIKSFEDMVIANKDVRLIQDEKGEIILLYGIIDKETIIITVNEKVFKEIVNRLNKEIGLKR
jgi:hypothetical protein